MTERVIMAGSGGQGLMVIGKLLASAGMHEGKEVTGLPSYGAEVRGGTATFHVVLSDEPIPSPAVEQADTLLIMNQPSYDKYRALLKRGGLLVLNTSMAGPSDALERAAPAEILPIPATEAANDLGNVRVANVIILGAYLARKAVVSEPTVIACLQAEFAGREHLAEVNRTALQKGIELAGHGKVS